MAPQKCGLILQVVLKGSTVHKMQFGTKIGGLINQGGLKIVINRGTAVLRNYSTAVIHLILRDRDHYVLCCFVHTSVHICVSSLWLAKLGQISHWDKCPLPPPPHTHTHFECTLGRRQVWALPLAFIAGKHGRLVYSLPFAGSLLSYWHIKYYHSKNEWWLSVYSGT